ncbi:hypoxanthine phosphoribosyltransferase [Candidatus Bipolaricaulota bacterium]|nr:hypoxanthine phosphoribosyltransferase [Candidatus Bipolaricaulota bacterium]
MSNVAPRDCVSRVLFSQDAIHARVEELGRTIAKDYGSGNVGRDEHKRPIILICVLRGAFMLLADLARQIPIQIQYDFICVSSYGNGTSPGAVRFVKDLDLPIRGRDVIIVEDIVDTGHTLDYLLRVFSARQPASIRVCALIDKPARRAVSVNVDYAGFTLESDEFVIGYGMDYAELYRNLPYIGVLDPTAVQ